MKALKLKLIITTLILLTTNAMAKTQGHYFGASIINTKFSFDSISCELYTEFCSSKSVSDYGVGIDYKYAINRNGFYIAPKIFYDANNINNKDHSSTTIGGDNLTIKENHKLNNSFGLGAELGYDLSNKFSFFFAASHKTMMYLHEYYIDDKVANVAFNKTGYYKRSEKQEVISYGIGSGIKISEKLRLNFSYETSFFYKPTNTIKYDTDKHKLSHKIFRTNLSYNY
ncbi:outer membrane beta-barrel protein [Rickettsiales bacterium]|jgi:hypothetical protein|nr:outer membrane beta-barrel protein [Rickettsiales bacterium]